MHSESEMPILWRTLFDIAVLHGCAKVQVGKTVQDILRLYAIDDFRSKPSHQHQNYAERRIQELTKYTGWDRGPYLRNSTIIMAQVKGQSRTRRTENYKSRVRRTGNYQGRSPVHTGPKIILSCARKTESY